MNRKKSKNKKDTSFKVRFNGRYKINSNQANAKIAYRLLHNSSSKKNAVKSEIIFDDAGFHVCKSLYLIRKIDFYVAYIFNYFIFEGYQSQIIIIEKENDNMWMSYFQFKDESDANNFIAGLEKKMNGSDVVAESGRHIQHKKVSVSSVTFEDKVDDSSDYCSLPSYRSHFQDLQSPSKLQEGHEWGPGEPSEENLLVCLDDEMSFEDRVKDFFTLDDARFIDGKVSLDVDIGVDILSCNMVKHSFSHPATRFGDAKMRFIDDGVTPQLTRSLTTSDEVSRDHGPDCDSLFGLHEKIRALSADYYSISESD